MVNKAVDLSNRYRIDSNPITNGKPAMVVDCAPNGVAYVRNLDPKNYSVLLALGPRETLAIEIMYGKYLLRPRNSIWGPRFETNVRRDITTRVRVTTRDILEGVEECHTA